MIWLERSPPDQRLVRWDHFSSRALGQAWFMCLPLCWLIAPVALRRLVFYCWSRWSALKWPEQDGLSDYIYILVQLETEKGGGVMFSFWSERNKSLWLLHLSCSSSPVSIIKVSRGDMTSLPLYQFTSFTLSNVFLSRGPPVGLMCVNLPAEFIHSSLTFWPRRSRILICSSSPEVSHRLITHDSCWNISLMEGNF